MKDVNVLLDRKRSDGISSPSRDDDSTLLNQGTHSSILDDNTKSDSSLPEVSSETKSNCTLHPNWWYKPVWSGVVYRVVCVKVTARLTPTYFNHDKQWMRIRLRWWWTLCVVRGGVNPEAFAWAMERAVSTTSWFTGSPAHSQRSGRYLSGTSVLRAYRWKRR